MNAFVVAQEFVTVLRAASGFSTQFPVPNGSDVVANVRNAQESCDVTLPRLVIEARLRPLVGSANVHIADVQLIIETDEAAANSLAEHNARVDAVRAKVFGLAESTAAATKAALATAISAAGRVNLDPRYTAQPPETPLTPHRFKTILKLRGGVFFPPP